MTIQFHCPKCGQPNEAQENKIGQDHICSECKAECTVPAPPYVNVTILAGALRVLGWLMLAGGPIFIGATTGKDADSTAIGLTISFCVIAGMGTLASSAILKCLRDIGQNTAYLKAMLSQEN